MSVSGLRLLVLLHDAGWTGASVVALRLARRLTTDHGVEVTTLAREPGPMLAAFAGVGPVHLEHATGRPGSRRLDRSARRRRLRDLAKAADVVYASTLTHGGVLAGMGPDGPPVVTHVHELAGALARFTSQQDLEVACDRTDRWIAASDGIASLLTTRFEVAPASLTVVRECLEPADMAGATPTPSLLEALPGQLLVGAVGTADARKGADLLVPVAQRVGRLLPDTDVAFRWLGADPAGAAILAGQAAAAGVPSVRAVGVLTPPWDAISALDVLLLPSREDPYPLVVLEAASLGVPTVCFEGGGGAPEVVRDDAGVAVPFADLDAMAAAVAALVRDPERRGRLGAVARRRAAEHGAADAAREVAGVLALAATRPARTSMRRSRAEVDPPRSGRGAPRRPRSVARDVSLRTAPALLAALRRTSVGVGAVTLHHEVVDRPTTDAERFTHIATSVLEAQLGGLRRHVDVVSLGDLPAALVSRRRGEPLPVALTFDDDLTSHIEVARLLAVLELPATFFLTDAALGARVCAAGGPGIEVGSHTHGHRRLPTLTQPDLEAALAPPPGLTSPAAVAYPHGDADSRVTETARASGYALGVTTAAEPLRPGDDQLALGRVTADGSSADALLWQLARVLVAGRRRPAQR